MTSLEVGPISHVAVISVACAVCARVRRYASESVTTADAMHEWLNVPRVSATLRRPLFGGRAVAHVVNWWLRALGEGSSESSSRSGCLSCSGKEWKGRECCACKALEGHSPGFCNSR